YRLLSPELQRFFCRLSVFRGGGTVEAAGAGCGEPMGPDFLGLLREGSLALTGERGGEVGFCMLETLLGFAGERFSAEDRAAVQQCHANYFLTLAEEAESNLQGPEQATWLDRLETEHDNLRAALGWCRIGEAGAEMRLRLSGALWRFWQIRGHL